MTPRRLRLLASAVALVASGVYVFVYLYRWEWHRALVAAALFLAVEVGVTASVVVERLGRLESRLDRLAETERAEDVRARIHHAAPQARVRFRWLEPTDRLSVFVPILLGAGVAVSALAWCVERLSRATAGTVLEGRLAHRLAPVSLPVGTLAGPVQVHSGPVQAPSGEVRARPRGIPRAAAAVLVLLLVGTALDALADATQNRPDVAQAAPASSITLEVARRRTAISVQRAASDLWAVCARQAGPRYRLVGVSEAAPGLVEMVVEPGLGRYAERRLRGCLQDATADRLRGRVRRVEHQAQT